MGLFRRTRTEQFYHDIGWGRVGYAQEPIHVFNDEYTARPMPQPFDRAWQGFQKRQQERYMDTEWNRWGFRDSYQTEQLQTTRFQQYGSYDQIRGTWGPVPATAYMSSTSAQPTGEGGLLSDLVTAVKKAWKGNPGAG